MTLTMSKQHINSPNHGNQDWYLLIYFGASACDEALDPNLAINFYDVVLQFLLEFHQICPFLWIYDTFFLSLLDNAQHRYCL